MTLTGTPLKGRDLEALKLFLKGMDLEYDAGIGHTHCILNDMGDIIATGSVEQNVLKCIAIDPAYQGQGLSASIITALVEYAFSTLQTHLFIFTKPKNRQQFEELSFYTIFESESVLFMENRRTGFADFLQGLVKETPPQAMEPGKTIGAIVANCNPVTLGHLYLFQQACLQCDYVHVFILSDDRSAIPAAVRYALVKEATQDMPQIILHRASNYLVSAATFPSYFHKDQATAQAANCLLDLQLFGQRIAPALHITQRFVGTEPLCQVTGAYNQAMKLELPNHNIAVVELQRKECDHQVISASLVRQLYQAEQIDQLSTLVPHATLQYLQNQNS